MKEQNKWNITANRYVGYIDIMGFKDMVQRSDHEEIYETMKTINESAQDNATIKWNSGEDHVTVTNYSDSIIVYSKDESFESCDAFICTMAGLSSDLFQSSIPHRGAFAFGKMTLDTKNSIFFGQPLIDAYLLEAEINYYGVVGHSSAEKEIADLERRHGESVPYYIEYPVPFKGGSSKHITIPPMFSGRFLRKNYQVDAEGIEAKYKALKESITNLRFRTSGHLRKYVDNTVEYHKWLEENW